MFCREFTGVPFFGVGFGNGDQVFYFLKLMLTVIPAHLTISELCSSLQTHLFYFITVFGVLAYQ